MTAPQFICMYLWYFTALPEPYTLNSEQSLADILESFQFMVAKTRHYNIGREDIIMFTDNYN